MNVLIKQKYGRKMTLLDLLCDKEIVIPIIQRDYAQGRKDIKKSNEIETIRESFLDTIFDSVVNERQIVLDFIYGSEDSVNRFQPIDGQQRLTTLFLLYWYFSVKDGRSNPDKELLFKFSYETRHSSTDFCKSIVKSLREIPKFQFNNSISDYIKNCPWFHRTWEYDPTIVAMLNMLDSIHNKFFDVQNGYEILTRTEKPIISFWVLSLDDFGLSDDLFIKMNARGKKLSKFENFKASFEDHLDEIKVSFDIADRWKSQIDNDWLDYFWEKYSKFGLKKNNVEMYMYKYILLVSEIIYYKRRRKSALQLDFSLESGYSNIIKVVFTDEESVNYLCDAMDFLLKVEESEYKYDLEEVIKYLDNYIRINNYNLVYSAKSNIFTCIDFCIKFGYNESSLFKDYRRLVKKLIRGQRTLRPDQKKYFSNLDTSNIGSFLLGIEYILNKLKLDKSINDVLAEMDIKDITGLSYLKHEIDKAVIIKNSRIDSSSTVKEIERFEGSKHFKGLIHNVLDYKNKRMLLLYNDFKELMEQDYGLILRAIISFDFYMEDRFSGVWNQFWIKKDDEEENSYFQAPYYKKFIGFSPDIDDEEFGDILLTRDSGKISIVVKAFLKKFGEMKASSSHKSANDIIVEIIESNLKELISPDSEQYYFVKYPDFVTGKFNVYGQRTQYAIRKCINGSYGQGHYNPYLKAVCRIVNSDPTINIKVSYKNKTDKDSEELDPIILSNGIKMYLSKSKEWKILNINKLKLGTQITNMIYEDTLKTNKKDCIEAAVDFIKLL